MRYSGRIILVNTLLTCLPFCRRMKYDRGALTLDEQPVYSIGAVERMVGIPAATIRNWEDRYGLITPERSAGGHRLYSRAQVEQLRFLKRELARGLQPADAHRVLAEGMESGEPMPRDERAGRIAAVDPARRSQFVRGRVRRALPSQGGLRGCARPRCGRGRARGCGASPRPRRRRDHDLGRDRSRALPAAEGAWACPRAWPSPRCGCKKTPSPRARMRSSRSRSTRSGSPRPSMTCSGGAPSLHDAADRR